MIFDELLEFNTKNGGQFIGSSSLLVIAVILVSHSCQSQPFHGRLLLKLFPVLGHSYLSY